MIFKLKKNYPSCRKLNYQKEMIIQKQNSRLESERAGNSWRLWKETARKQDRQPQSRALPVPRKKNQEKRKIPTLTNSTKKYENSKSGLHSSQGG